MQIGDEEKFMEECGTQLTSNSNLNTWFDPIDPIAAITQAEICDLHWKLFNQLQERQRTSISEYVSFSYLASLDLYANAMQQEDYENCIALDVTDSPNEWTTQFVMKNPVLLIWDSSKKLEAAADTATAI